MSKARSPGGGRKRGGARPLFIIALTALLGVMVLAGANMALGSRATRAHRRFLLQGAEPEAALQAAMRPEGGPVPDAVAEPSGAAAGGGGGGGGAGSDPAAAEAGRLLGLGGASGGTSSSEQQRQQLGPDSDLATFAAPDTHCVVTPSHPKVALLFLTHGDLPHDTLWTQWLREARGLLPRRSLLGEEAFCLKQCDAEGESCTQRCGRGAACNPLCLDALQRRQGADRSPSVLQQQHLFSVYVHARPTLKDYREPSAFAGRLIPDRMITKPGTPAMAAAAKKLLEAAALDPRNERFVLVGDTTVPLYHPALVWRQLMAEERSRVDACPHEDSYLQRQRYTPALSSDRFRPGRHWRRSSQWWVLNRKHADLVVHDTEVAGLFKKHCYVGWDEAAGRHRECVSDQHYIPSLLAMYGLDNETTCDPSGATAWTWERVEQAPGEPQGGDAAVPKTYQPGHITPGLVTGLRRRVWHAPGGAPAAGDDLLCAGWPAAAGAAREAYLNASSKLTPASCPATLGSDAYLAADPFEGKGLDARCPLLARKFSAAAARWVHRVYRSCSASLDVLPCSQRLDDRDNNWWA